MEEKSTKEISLELSKEVAAGTYSNLAIITHSNTEFVIDFARVLPGIPKAQIASRIVIAPEHAKRLFFALKDNIAKFESQNGEIRLTSAQRGSQMPPFGFGPNNVEA